MKELYFYDTWSCNTIWTNFNNKVFFHPAPVLASSGIDYNIKIWSPTAEDPGYDEQRMAEVTAPVLYKINTGHQKLV